MNSQNQSAQNPAADRLALIAAAQTQLDEIAETFKFFITTNRAGITRVDCSIVIEEAEKLIVALQAINALVGGAE